MILFWNVLPLTVCMAGSCLSSEPFLTTQSELGHLPHFPVSVLFWVVIVAVQETAGVTGKFGLEVWNEAGKRLIGFC